MKNKLQAEFIGKNDSFWGITFIEHDDGGCESTFEGLGLSGVSCTGYAVRIKQFLGDRAKVVGFYNEENKQSLIGELHAGHDFAVVDGRYIVDPWLVEVESGNITTPTDKAINLCGQGVFDLEDPADAELVDTLYGNKGAWKELTSWKGIFSFQDWKKDLIKRYHMMFGLSECDLPEDDVLRNHFLVDGGAKYTAQELGEKYDLVRIDTKVW